VRQTVVPSPLLPQNAQSAFPMSTKPASDSPSDAVHPVGGERVCVIIVNWNGWRDTIECLESLFRSDYSNYTVVVCDNASADDSLEQIRIWANGRIAAQSTNPQLAHLTSPPVAKPIQLSFYSNSYENSTPPASGHPLVLIQTGANLGFAGGCNVGLQYALRHEEYEYAWLLNNDTVVERDTLSKLVEKMRTEPRLGICGSILLDYRSEKNVRAVGGRRYSAWSGRVLPQRESTMSGPHPPSQPIDYADGASMLVRREFLKTVGLMEEAYFLYFEELDWATRAGDRFQIGYAPLSFVYHKEGASIGTHVLLQSRSLLAEWYATRNRLLFTRKYYPAFVPSVLVWVALTALHRLLTGNPRKARQIAAAAWDGLTCSKTSMPVPASPTKRISA
jgi:GT2 family glycosyltransferase